MSSVIVRPCPVYRVLPDAGQLLRVPALGSSKVEPPMLEPYGQLAPAWLDSASVIYGIPIELLIFFACWLALAILGAFLLVVGLEQLEARYSYLHEIKAAFEAFRKRNAEKRAAKRD